MGNYKWYRVTLKHDKGTYNVRIFAESAVSAIDRVIDNEGAPIGAVKGVQRCNKPVFSN